jgi:hypothetical protein
MTETARTQAMAEASRTLAELLAERDRMLTRFRHARSIPALYLRMIRDLEARATEQQNRLNQLRRLE